MKLAIVFAALPLFAVDGVVTNKTSGKPQPGATVTFYKLGNAGMESMETVKSDAAGRFTFEYKPEPGPNLIQAAFDGVTYNKMLPPASPMSGINVEVYNAQSKPGDSKVSQHMLLFEPFEGKLTVNENLIYQNSGNITYNDPANGTIRFFLPEAAGGKVKVMVSSPNGMPVERAATATKTAGIYVVDHPIKPGETRVQLTYEYAMPDPPVFTGKILHKEGSTRLVTPKDVTLKSEAITELGREPATQAAIYSLIAPEFTLRIEGAGSLRAPSGDASEEGPGIQEILPRVYDRLYLVLGLTAAVLVLGFIMVYRSSPSESSAKGKRPA